MTNETFYFHILVVILSIRGVGLSGGAEGRSFADSQPGVCSSDARGCMIYRTFQGFNSIPCRAQLWGTLT